METDQQQLPGPLRDISATLTHTHIDDINSIIFIYQDADRKPKQAGPGDLKYQSDQSDETWKKEVT